MSQSALELENVLQSLVAEHRKLLGLIEKHQAALRTLATSDLFTLGEAINTSRTRLNMLEVRRRNAVVTIGKTNKLAPGAPLSDIAELFPQRKPFLLKLRTELKEVATQLQRRTAVSAKIASALSGHLNTVVRLVAGVVEQAGVYNRAGSPTVALRIGALEAVA